MDDRLIEKQGISIVPVERNLGNGQIQKKGTDQESIQLTRPPHPQARSMRELPIIEIHNRVSLTRGRATRGPFLPDGGNSTRREVNEKSGKDHSE
ncbi:MAG: hypothetical protein NPIRA06_19230 [Nitrospirales bacterium]|nr:MAG: hypothetical protein NPIRA06_19230 [Nitrospirales bacterium]